MPVVELIIGEVTTDGYCRNIVRFGSRRSASTWYGIDLSLLQRCSVFFHHI